MQNYKIKLKVARFLYKKSRGTIEGEITSATTVPTTSLV